MMKTYSIGLCSLVLCLALSPAQGQDSKPATSPATTHQEKDFLGCWQEEDAENPNLLLCEPARVSWFDPDTNKLQFYRATYQQGKIIINIMGHHVPLPLTWQDGNLMFKGKTGLRKLHKVENVPAKLCLEPLKLGTARDLPAAELKTIQEELGKRFKEDQSVRPDPNNPVTWNDVDVKKMAEVDTSNTKYVLELVAKYGWIDVERFGAEASLSAWFIVQHSGHLPLMQAVLPEIKKVLGKKVLSTSLGNVNLAESYAMLFDRMQVMTGYKQRYGTQMGQNDRGESILLAMEDPKQVDRFRAEIGLDPILPGLELLRKQNPKQALKIEEAPETAQSTTKPARSGSLLNIEIKYDAPEVEPVK